MVKPYDSNRVVYLNIMAWAFAIGGEHFTGSLKCADDSISTVEYLLSRSQALSLNKKDAISLTRYKPGEKCYRFFSKKDLIKIAIKVALDKWKNIRLIIEGQTGVIQPQLTIWCIDIKQKKEMNVLFEKTEMLYKKHKDPWTICESRMQKICDKWELKLKNLIVIKRGKKKIAKRV